MTTKYAGIAMMVGILLSIVASLLYPGNTLVNGVDQTDFPAALEVIADAPTLAHAMVFLSILAMLLISFGAYGLFPLATRLGGLSGTLLKFGIIISIIEWSINIIGLGMRHFVTHLNQRASNAAAGSEDQILLEETALVIHTTLTAVFLAFITIYPFATMLVGYGVGKLIQTMNAFKIGANVLLVSGAAGLITYLAAMFVPGDEPVVYLMIFNILLFIGSICLFIVGLGMYRGSEGLSEEAASS
ncbi:MAG: hypothetical protein F4180_08010 [Chloroflexi bacterium]|nr:hypothetical protein [Chloroflexota bacterium]